MQKKVSSRTRKVGVRYSGHFHAGGMRKGNRLWTAKCCRDRSSCLQNLAARIRQTSKKMMWASDCEREPSESLHSQSERLLLSLRGSGGATFRDVRREEHALERPVSQCDLLL